MHNTNIMGNMKSIANFWNWRGKIEKIKYGLYVHILKSF